MRNIFTWVKSIEIKDEKTIIFNLSKPIPQFIKVLSSPNYAIFKKSFIDEAKRNPKMWDKPLGCGNYKVIQSNKDSVSLAPVKLGLPIVFYLNKENQLTVEEINKYDIVSLNLIGDINKASNFNKIELFDPLQIFIGLNLKSKKWLSKSDRCAFLSGLNINKVLKLYEGAAIKANDFLPKGSLGYSSTTNYLANIKKNYQDTFIKKSNPFCLSYLGVSIPNHYRNEYLKMIENIYPKLQTNIINNTKQFGIEFAKKKCDALIFALKSNYLDGYEYLQIFANNDANFSGVINKDLVDNIRLSQNFNDPFERAKKYRKIIDQIENSCVILPLMTIPMRIVYVRKNLKTPGIGLGALNEYSLANIVEISNE